MRVQLVRAWPRRHEAREVDLADGATVADALRAADWTAPAGSGMSVFGVVVGPATVLRDGDRLELLRPLLMDPKEARRRRAGDRMR